ncbi:MAG: AI-2E family transporter [Candidatus Kapaibacteriota bacterium]
MQQETEQQTVFGIPLNVGLPIVFTAITCMTLLVLTGLVSSPLILFLIAFFLIYPYRQRSFFAKRLLQLNWGLFILWMLMDLNSTVLPFVFSFILAFLLDPIINAMERLKFKRWLASMIMLGILGGILATVAIFVFPPAYAQLDQVTKEVSRFVVQTTKYLESRQFYSMLQSFGIPKETVKQLVQDQVMPKAETLFSSVMDALFALLTNISLIAAQVLNLILIPIITFYFLKDLPALKKFLKEILGIKNPEALSILERVSDILKIYVGWQVIAVIWIGGAASLLLSIFGIPYAIVLGVMFGLLNPIPFFGSIASMIIGIIVAIFVDPENALNHVIAITLIVNGLHFLNAYVIEPRVLGSRVGLHPVLLLASIFIFGHFFGFIGLLIAVPTTAILMMFFREWEQTLHASVMSNHIANTTKDQE